MKCRGNFKFKSVTRKDGGEFKNDKGEIIKYKESYSLKVDEQAEGNIYERTFKVAVDSPLVSQLNTLKPYDNIVLEFDVNIYGSRTTIVPVALVK